MNLFKFGILQIILLLLASNVFANAPKEVKTRITANVIDIKRKLQITEFIGNVVVKRAADTMTANSMTVFYEEKTAIPKLAAEKKSSIKKIEAKNNVKIFSNNFVAKGDYGHYSPKDETFTLENNVTVNNGNSIAMGEKFIYNLTTKTGNLVGKKEEGKAKLGDDRRVVVFIDDAKEKKDAKEKTEAKKLTKE